MSQEDTVPRGPIEAMERGTWLKIRDQRTVLSADFFHLMMSKRKSPRLTGF